MPPPTTAIAPLVVRTAPDLLVVWQSLGHDFSPESEPTARLDAEALPTLGPATAENGSALPGAHTSPEAMLLLPAPVVWLERSLHDVNFLSTTSKETEVSDSQREAHRSRAHKPSNGS